MSELQDVKVGDTMAVVAYWGVSRATVTRLTKTQIITRAHGSHDKASWRKKDGHLVGSDGKSPETLTPMTPELKIASWRHYTAQVILCVVGEGEDFPKWSNEKLSRVYDALNLPDNCDKDSD